MKSQQQARDHSPIVSSTINCVTFTDDSRPKGPKRAGLRCERRAILTPIHTRTFAPSVASETLSSLNVLATHDFTVLIFVHSNLITQSVDLARDSTLKNHTNSRCDDVSRHESHWHDLSIKKMKGDNPSKINFFLFLKSQCCTDVRRQCCY